MKREQSLELGLLLFQFLVFPVLVIPKGFPEAHNEWAAARWDYDCQWVVFTVTGERLKERDLRLILIPC